MSKYLRMKGSVEDISEKSVISNCTKSKQSAIRLHKRDIKICQFLELIKIQITQL